MTDQNTEKMVQDAANQAAHEAVKQTLTAIGLDVSDPFEVQKDMAALREMRMLLRDPDFQADLAQIRALRTSGKFIRTKVAGTVIGLIVTGICGLIWLTLVGGSSPSGE